MEASLRQHRKTKNISNLRNVRVSEMVLWTITHLVQKPDDLSLIPRPYTETGEESRSQRCLPSVTQKERCDYPSYLLTYMPRYANTHK